MLSNQFYPTPASLCARMLGAFKKKPSYESFILEPQAGRGDLLAPLIKDRSGYSVDVIESDPVNLEVLKSLDVNIVGYDFLKFQGLKDYTHIIMNPPFNAGVDHLLHAWKIITNGEIVCLLNAETIKNPCSEKKQLLLKIIEDNGGSVEFVTGGFVSPDTERKTSVECAIVWLSKETAKHDLYIDGLRPDVFKDLGQTRSTNSNLAIPESTIANAVRIFNAAVKCLKDEHQMGEQLRGNTAYYRGLLNDSFIPQETDEKGRPVKMRHSFTDDDIKSYRKRYEEMRVRAWGHVLAASNITDGISSKVSQTLRDNFKEISNLEFTKENIYGFLGGLIEAKHSANDETLCEVFDLVTRYNTNNRVWFKGWISNDKHKVAYRIGMTRFIIPITNSWSGNGLDYAGERKLNDFDIAFAILDGKRREDVFGVSDLLKSSADELAAGKRLSSDYFDIRYYPKSRTIHFFAKSKSLVDRLNRTVGALRQWLPDFAEKANEAFWEQYDNAESITAELNKDPAFVKLHSWHSMREDHQIEQHDKALLAAGESLGYQMGSFIATGPKSSNSKDMVLAADPVCRAVAPIKKRAATKKTKNHTPVNIDLLKAQYALPL